MMTLCTTLNTANSRDSRWSLLSAYGANLIARDWAAYLRVDLLGSLHLLSRFGNAFDATKSSVDGEPAVGTIGIATALFGNQPIDERQYWSPGDRRTRFIRQT
ncbi:MAG: hypothetical protein AAF846_12000 [Chloroflexota bacterium]